MVSKQIKRLYVFLVLLFLYAPILVLIVFSFNASKSTANWAGFSLQWYVELFHDRQIMKALYYTLSVALIASYRLTSSLASCSSAPASGPKKP